MIPAVTRVRSSKCSLLFSQRNEYISLETRSIENEITVQSMSRCKMCQDRIQRIHSTHMHVRNVIFTPKITPIEAFAINFHQSFTSDQQTGTPKLAPPLYQ